MKNIRKIINEVIDEMKVYHSSPFNFKRFGLNHVNDAKNGQIYGYGIYFDFEKNNAYGKNNYYVDLPDDKKLYLFGDKPLSKTFVRDAFYKLLKYIKQNKPRMIKIWGEENLIKDMSGILNCDNAHSLYGTISYFLGSDKETSFFIKKYLKKIGIIYSLEGSTPNKRHYYAVIFDSSYIKITRKEINN